MPPGWPKEADEQYLYIARLANPWTVATARVVLCRNDDFLWERVDETSGSRGLNQWLEYERDIRADYERAFGEPPGALVGIGIMTDSDNTRSRTQAWYGPVRFVPAPAGRP